jgi:beta-lactamase regulating signal transducer with metallopeptidase domain
VFDVLVFEFMGLAMLALCVIVLVVPAQRRPARRFRDT